MSLLHAVQVPRLPVSRLEPVFGALRYAGLARAADQVYVSCEKIVPTEALGLPERARFNPFERSLVTGVVELPYGAHPTGATPAYGIDLDHLKLYADATAWEEYRRRFVTLTDHADYIDAVGGGARIAALPAPIY